MSRIILAAAVSLLALAATPAAAQYGGSPDQQIDPPTAVAGKSDEQADTADPGAFDKSQSYDQPDTDVETYAQAEAPPPEIEDGGGPVACRRSDGSTGAIVGGGAGALVGRGIDRHGERGTGTIIGAVLGALIGHAIEQGSACR